MTSAQGKELVLMVPHDKSITHRALMVAGLADGKSRIVGFLNSEDTKRTMDMMRALGVEYQINGSEVIVKGVGLQGFREPMDVIDAGNSGTTMRIGAGILAGQPFVSVITGDASLKKRPMDRVIKPLSLMGANIVGRGGNRFAPICFFGGELEGIRWEVTSAQVKSALMLAGLRAKGTVKIKEIEKTRDHTERLFSYLGIKIGGEGGVICVAPQQRIAPFDIEVPGDFSSASFFIVAFACIPDAKLRVKDLGLNPTRTGLLQVLKRMGAKIEVENMRYEYNEPVGDLVVEGGELKGTVIDKNEIPSMIDEIPILCVAGAMAKGRTEVFGAYELRVKESDRIKAIITAFQAIGIPCGEHEDGLWIEGRNQGLKDAVLNTFNDHRIAMSLLVLEMLTQRRFLLSDTSCIATSFPNFFDKLIIVRKSLNL